MRKHVMPIKQREKISATMRAKHIKRSAATKEKIRRSMLRQWAEADKNNVKSNDMELR